MCVQLQHIRGRRLDEHATVAAVTATTMTRLAYGFIRQYALVAGKILTPFVLM